MSAFSDPFASSVAAAAGPDDAFSSAIASSFGFEVPTGNPAAIEQAVKQASLLAQDFTIGAWDLHSACSTAMAGWQGSAQTAFAGYVSQVRSAVQANGEALAAARLAMGSLAQELESAQRVTRAAAEQCATYDRQVAELAGQAEQFCRTADGLEAQAAVAPHPVAQTELGRQAGVAREQQATAARAAADARAELEAAQRRGIEAHRGYERQAQALNAQIAGATDRLRPIPRPAGGAPVPVTISPADAATARKLLASVLADPAAKSDTEAADELLRLNGGHRLTPGTIAALLHASAAAKQDRGSVIDGLGGLVHTATFGLVSFGNSQTARYRGGELAALIPIDPESLVLDADRTATRELVDGASRIDYSRNFDGDIKAFAPGTASLHSGPTDADLTLVQYYDRSGGGSYKWWTTTHDANAMPTVKDVTDQLALEPEWGDRNAVAVARVPRGTDVTFISGEAGSQATTPGGAIQHRFLDFDQRWIITKQPLP